MTQPYARKIFLVPPETFPLLLWRYLPHVPLVFASSAWYSLSFIDACAHKSHLSLIAYCFLPQSGVMSDPHSFFFWSFIFSFFLPFFAEKKALFLRVSFPAQMLLSSDYMLLAAVPIRSKNFSLFGSGAEQETSPLSVFLLPSNPQPFCPPFLPESLIILLKGVRPSVMSSVSRQRFGFFHKASFFFPKRKAGRVHFFFSMLEVQGERSPSYYFFTFLVPPSECGLMLPSVA